LEVINYQRLGDNIDSKNLLLILFIETREIQKNSTCTIKKAYKMAKYFYRSKEF